jgi:putative redox protein
MLNSSNQAITAQISYLGNLRTEATHVKSGSKIITDAPTDNHGKGEAFSPTDLVATAYVSCLLTVVGIHCANNAINYTHGEGTVVKIMGDNPRKIDRLEIEIDFSGNNWEVKTQVRLERVALACPVANTLDEYVDVNINFKY